MKKALYILGYLFLATNLVVCGYTIYMVSEENAHIDYVQSVFVPSIAASSYLRGCLDMNGDSTLCKEGARQIEEETREILKFQE